MFLFGCLEGGLAREPRSNRVGGSIMEFKVFGRWGGKAIGHLYALSTYLQYLSCVRVQTTKSLAPYTP